METMTLFESLTSRNPKDLPTPPREVSEFNKLSKYDKIRAGEAFYRQEWMQEYLNNKWDAELHNKVSFQLLWEHLQGVKTDTEKHAIKVKLSQFKRKIMECEKPFEALALDFRNYPYEETQQAANWTD